MEQPWPTNRVLTVERNYRRVKSLNVAHYDTHIMVTVTAQKSGTSVVNLFCSPNCPEILARTEDYSLSVPIQAWRTELNVNFISYNEKSSTALKLHFLVMQFGRNVSLTDCINLYVENLGA